MCLPHKLMICVYSSYDTKITRHFVFELLLVIKLIHFKFDILSSKKNINSVFTHYSFQHLITFNMKLGIIIILLTNLL